MTSKSGQSSEVLALVYLGAPVFLFFAYFVRYEIAVPSVLILLISAYRSIKNTVWVAQRIDFGLLAGFLAIAAIWVFSSGGLGLFYQNSDWSKHYAILNLLSEQSWPPITADGSLRYYLGWYLVPAFALKISNGHGGYIFGATWTCIGVVIFFWLIAPEFKTKSKVLIGVIAFTLFSGADIIGTWVTNFERGNILHWEWWNGWIEYSSITTSLYWVQQHALPAWIGVALLLRQLKRGEASGSLVFLFVFAGFWSPFVAIGLVPFAVLLCFKCDLTETLLSWRSWLVLILVGFPVIAYLLTDTANVPHGMIWLNKCVSAGGPCFSWSSLALFLALEVGGSALVMYFCKVNIPASFLITAIVTLTLIPLYLAGSNNDFAMRASLPAIAILALSCASAFTTATWPRMWLPLSALAIGLAVPVSEAYRGLFISRLDFSKYTFRDALAGIEDRKAQYFASSSIWVLRSNIDK